MVDNRAIEAYNSKKAKPTSKRSKHRDSSQRAVTVESGSEYLC